MKPFLQLITEEACNSLTAGFDLFYPSYGAQRALLRSLLKKTRHCSPRMSDPHVTPVTTEDPFLQSVMRALSIRRNLSCLFAPLFYAPTLLPSMSTFVEPNPTKKEVVEILKRLLRVICESIRVHFRKVPVTPMTSVDGNKWAVAVGECQTLLTWNPSMKLFLSFLK